MIIGIDLGTTHSSIALWENNRPFLIPDPLGRVLRPSVIGLDSSGKMITGFQGEQSLSFAPLKRLMGKNRLFRIGKHAFRPEEFLSFMIKSLIADGENYLKREIKGAVITVPAHFNDVQKKSIRHAGELAGVNVEGLLNDSTAAALIFNAKNPWVHGKVLIMDLGGGTFEASIADIASGLITVLATTGDSCLGGGDFVDALENHILKKIEKEYGIKKELLSPTLKEEWRSFIQKMIHNLTDSHEAFFFAEYEGKNIKISITSIQFEEITKPLMSRIIDAVARVVEDAGLNFSDIEKVVLAGGAVKMPIISRAMTALFGSKGEFLLHPSSLGAAIAASVDASSIISDVCPYFLGIKVAEKKGEGRLIPLLERNTAVPISRTDRFYTSFDYQTTFYIQVFQGTNEQSHVVVGEVLVLVPPRLAGIECVEVRSSYNVSGLLQVEAMALNTGKYKKFISNHQIHYF